MRHIAKKGTGYRKRTIFHQQSKLYRVLTRYVGYKKDPAIMACFKSIGEHHADMMWECIIKGVVIRSKKREKE